jgi:hypothetical protein
VVKLNFRPDDEDAVPLHGAIAPANALVIEVSERDDGVGDEGDRSARDGGVPATASVRTVGRIRGVVSFTGVCTAPMAARGGHRRAARATPCRRLVARGACAGLFDFQRASAPRDARDSCDLVPLFLSRFDKPRHYWFREPIAVKTAAAVRAGRPRARRGAAADGRHLGQTGTRRRRRRFLVLPKWPTDPIPSGPSREHAR